MRTIRRLCLVMTFLIAAAAPGFAIIFGSVKGVVHDPQHRPAPGATVTLRARDAELTQTATTDANGEFQFAAVPIGHYTVSVVLQGFETAQEAVVVLSSATPVLHVQLQVAGVTATVTVSAAAGNAAATSVTPTTVLDRQDIRNTPGADQSNSMAAITAYVPGAYATHDQLHIRGGHQVTWLIDGVPVPNTNIASNVGPQFDPKDIDFLEVQRGSYGAQYGDRTYAIFNVVPRTGFERQREAELVLSAGSFYQTNNQASIGSHTGRFAYYASANVNRSSLGLDTPVAEVTHDRVHGFGGFSSLVFNVNPNNQLRLATSLRRDSYQIPVGPDERAASVADDEHESDGFVNLTWVRTLGSGRLLTVSPFYHQNAANFDGGPLDPLSTTDHHTSRYVGAQATFGADVARHTIQAGFYGFRQQDDQFFGLVSSDGSGQDFSVREQPSGHQTAVFVEDRFAATSWLTLTAGVRQTHFSGGVVENATSPRVGATVQIPSLDWTVRGFYGRFYQAPSLLTASGPLVDFVTSQNLGFVPLRGERDEEYQAGLTIPARGWIVDVDHFRTSATNFFDHNNVGNSNVFFPLTIQNASIRGWEATLRSPRSWRRAQFHVAYSHQQARASGAISGGLTDFAPAEDQDFPLDHDQRNTLSAGFSATLPRALTVAVTTQYGSGFPDDDTGTYLQGHTTWDGSVRKSLSERFSVALNVLNVTNRRLLVDNSLTFGGTHFNRPREVYVEARYRFHY